MSFSIKEYLSFRSPVFWKCLSVLVLLLIGWLIYLDAQIRHKFEGQRWSLPAQVFARSLDIYDGKGINMQNLEHELKLLNYRPVAKVQQTGEYSRNGSSLEIFIRAHARPEGKQAARHIQFIISNDQVSQLIDRQTRTDPVYSLEPFKIGGIYPAAKEERQLLSYKEFPEALKAALLVTEDRNFNSHVGISPVGIFRAMWVNFKAGQVVQGGSTLTQQLVKNFFLTSERSLLRKINEAMMAVLLELHYSKAVIMETYMNEIFLGQSGKLAIHGFEAASNFYFGKHLQECDISELALLVAMVKGPSYYNPRRYPERSRERRNLVLALLHESGYLNASAYKTALNRPLHIVNKPLMASNQYPAFMDLVKRQLSKTYQEEDLRSEGLKIYTTLDPQIQFRLEQAAKEKVSQLSSHAKQPNLQTASVVAGVGSGEILAVLGDKQPQYQGFNRALDANRPIGSLIKPAIYLAALSAPDRFHLASLLNDQAFKLTFENGTHWQPQNFDKQDHGQVLLIDALSQSYNLATARLGLDLGIQTVHKTLRKLGVNSPLNPYPSLFLGSQSLSPLEVTQMYLTIANQGFNIPLRAIREVTTKDGELLSRYPFEVEQVLSPEAVYLLQHAMQATMRNGTGRSTYHSLPESLLVAGKTGTTNDNRDSWFAGFSGDYLSVVWLGNDDNSTTPYTGSSGALSLWTEFMKRIPQRSVNMVQMESIGWYWFDKLSGTRRDEHCENTLKLPVWGPIDAIPYEGCDDHISTFKGWLKSWF